MTLVLKIDADFREVNKMLKELPGVAHKAAATAMTQTIYKAKEDDERDMRASFDRPTRYTMNALKVKKARSNDLTAELWVKDSSDAGKGTSPLDYLLPQVYGGPRNLKRFEKALRRAYILPQGMYAVPASGADYDQYGNMSRGQIVQIMTYFKAHPDAVVNGNNQALRTRLAKTTKKKRGFAYFVSKGGRLHPGIYKRIDFGFGSAVRPIVIFISKPPTYSKRLDFDKVSKAAADREFLKLFDAAMAKALSEKGYD